MIFSVVVMYCSIEVVLNLVQGAQQFLSKKDRLGEIPYLNELWAICNTQRWSEKQMGALVEWIFD